MNATEWFVVCVLLLNVAVNAIQFATIKRQEREIKELKQKLSVRVPSS